MVKLKLEKVRQWFTPIQAARFLFEDADSVSNEELLLELANLVNSFQLIVCLRNYEIEPLDGDDDAYLKLVEFYNHRQSELPTIGFFLKKEWMNLGVINEAVERVGLMDIYDFCQKYKENQLEHDDYVFWWDKLKSSETNIVFDARLKSCEFGFTQEELNRFIEEQLHQDKTKEPQDLKPRERETMVKIIYALAKNGYKYPSRGSLKDMIDDFEKYNNGASESTLKKYLDEFDTL